MEKKEKVVIGLMSSLIIGSVALVGLLFTVDPVSLKQSQFTYELHTEIPTSANNYLKANERVLENAVVNLANVKIDEVGVYEAYAEYSGKQYPFTIQIRDSLPPIASLVQTKYELKVGAILIASDLVKEIEDDSEYTVYFYEEGNPVTKTFNESGTFNDIFIIVEDIYGNKSNKLRLSVVVMEDNDAPVFTGVENKIIQLGTAFNPLEGVRASDAVDGDVTASIQVSGQVDIYTEGTYELHYSVMDLSNNTTAITRIITVQNGQVDNEEGIQDVADGPYLSVEKAKQLESTYLTISRVSFTGSNALELLQQMTTHLVKYTSFVPNGSGRIADSSYGAICENRATDQGFARALLYMCEQQAIECYYVSGTLNGMDMAWNIVKVGENYYHIDTAYQRINGIEFKLSSTSEMKELGYVFDEDYYPKCTKKFTAA